MSTDAVTATRTYLEMTSPAQFKPARLADPTLTVRQVDPPNPTLWRYLYSEVGGPYRWFDRLPWTEEEAHTYLADPRISLSVLEVDGTIAGYFELRREADGAVEIVYFGLLPAFTGRGLGGHLLTEAVERAWASSATRVWLHTCTFDHPNAIPNYISRGFVVFKTEQYVVR
jgi:ribosomal protein S18 acetylase RimI-like enzyme